MADGPLPNDKKLVTLGVTEPFTTSVKVSFIAALALALPVILWQAWAFLAPAVEPHLERVILAFVALAMTLFVLGVLFMYYVVLPRALDFLTSYDDNIYDIQIRASYYYSFAALTLLAGGLAFLMPIFILALVRLRVLTSTACARIAASRTCSCSSSRSCSRPSIRCPSRSRPSRCSSCSRCPSGSP